MIGWTLQVDYFVGETRIQWSIDQFVICCEASKNIYAMFSKRFFRLQPLFICIASLVIAEIDANHLYDDICAEPTFDASVAITESHILLFKNDYIWLLELDQYQLTSSISLRSIVDSCMGPGLATNVSPPYYAWSMHDSFKPQMDSICFHYVCIHSYV